MTGAGRVGGEYRLVHLAALAQRTRAFAHLLGDEHAETAAVALEALLTLILDGNLLYAGEARKAVSESGEALRVAIADRVERFARGTVTGDPDTGEQRHRLVQAVYGLLEAIGSIAAASAYGGPCVAFPVQHAGRDGAPLRLRGFDLYRIEMEDLRLFLLEMPWNDVEERPNGLTGLLEYAGRNGHVFDVRPARSLTSPPLAEGVLRLLYGSTLDPDFLEVLLQAPSRSIHIVNPLLVRRYKASWGLPAGDGTDGRAPSPMPARSCGPHKSVEELALEYTLALNRMFATSKNGPRDEGLPEHLF